MTKMAGTLLKGLEILEAFTGDEPNLKLQQVVECTGIPRATAYRLLRTLASRNYLKIDQRSGAYFLGPRVMSLGFSVLQSLGLRDTAHPYIEDLSHLTDQNVNLGIMDGLDIIYIDRIKKRRILNIEITIGSRTNTYQTSVGRAILAYLSKEELQKHLAQLLMLPEAQKYLGKNGNRLTRKLKKEREKGYALSDEELHLGMRTAGAPVFGIDDQVEGAINIAVMSHICSKEKLERKYVPMLIDTAKTISMARGSKRYENELQVRG